MRGSPAAPCGPACGAGSCRVVAGTLEQRDAHGAIVAWAKHRRKHRRKHHRRSPLHAGARTATRTRTRSSIPSPHQCLQSRRNPIRNPISDGAEKRQLHRSYLVHTHARTRTQVNTHARTYTHTDSACVERAHAGATFVINCRSASPTPQSRHAHRAAPRYMPPPDHC